MRSTCFGSRIVVSRNSVTFGRIISLARRSPPMRFVDTTLSAPARASLGTADCSTALAMIRSEGFASTRRG